MRVTYTDSVMCDWSLSNQFCKQTELFTTGLITAFIISGDDL